MLLTFPRWNGWSDHMDEWMTSLRLHEHNLRFPGRTYDSGWTLAAAQWDSCWHFPMIRSGNRDAGAGFIGAVWWHWEPAECLHLCIRTRPQVSIFDCVSCPELINQGMSMDQVYQETNLCPGKYQEIAGLSSLFRVMVKLGSLASRKYDMGSTCVGPTFSHSTWSIWHLQCFIRTQNSLPRRPA